MTDRFYEPDFAIDEQQKQGTLFDVALVMVILLTTFFSAFTTYKGFSFDIPSVLAAFLSVVIGLSLLAINLKIRDTRREGRSLMRTFVAFFIVFIFSFISNTNAIYTYFVQRDIVGQTQEEAWRVFDTQTKRVLTAISEQPEVVGYERWSNELETARRNLVRQITDERNPGFGELAREHYNEVIRQLGVNLTPLRAPPYNASIGQHRQYAQTLDELIGKQADALLSSHPAFALIEAKKDIVKLRAFYEEKMIDKEYHADTTDLMKRDLASIDASIIGLLTLDPAMAEIDNASDETGSFQYTWRNILHWVSPAAIVLAILLGALLDLLAPLMSVLLYRFDEDL